MASPGHRQNILAGRYEKTGVGIAIAANDHVLITQLFLRRATERRGDRASTGIQADSR